MSGQITGYDDQALSTTVIASNVHLCGFERGDFSTHYLAFGSLFIPDEWSLLTLDAAILCLEENSDVRDVYDVGTGCGILPFVLGELFPKRELSFESCDIKSESGRNVEINHRLFGRTARRPVWHIGDAGTFDLPRNDIGTRLVLANVPQLPVYSDEFAVSEDWSTDDFYKSAPSAEDDSVRAFGLGLLMDIVQTLSKQAPDPFYLAFCRSSRVPDQVLETFVTRSNADLVYLGKPHSVLNSDTNYTQFATVETRFQMSGRYHANGEDIGAKDLAIPATAHTNVHLYLQSCLLRIPASEVTT